MGGKRATGRAERAREKEEGKQEKGGRRRAGQRGGASHGGMESGQSASGLVLPIFAGPASSRAQLAAGDSELGGIPSRESQNSY